MTATCTTSNTTFSTVKNIGLVRNGVDAPAGTVTTLGDAYRTRVECLDLPYLVGTSGELLCPDDDLTVRVRFPEHPGAGLASNAKMFPVSYITTIIVPCSKEVNDINFPFHRKHNHKVAAKLSKFNIDLILRIHPLQAFQSTPASRQ